MKLLKSFRFGQTTCHFEKADDVYVINVLCVSFLIIQSVYCCCVVLHLPQSCTEPTKCNYKPNRIQSTTSTHLSKPILRKDSKVPMPSVCGSIYIFACICRSKVIAYLTSFLTSFHRHPIPNPYNILQCVFIFATAVEHRRGRWKICNWQCIG